MKPETEQKTLYTDIMQLGAAVLFVSLVIVLGMFVMARGEANDSAASNATAAVINAVSLNDGVERCLNAEGDSCRNRCSTGYLLVINGRVGLRDCYASDDPAAPSKTVAALRNCIERETGRPVGNSTVDPVKESLCMIDVPRVQVGDDSTDMAVQITTAEEDSRLFVPKACEAELNAVFSLRDRNSAQPIASALDAQICANRGPVVCYPKDYTNPSRGFTCVYKQLTEEEKALGGIGVTGGVLSGNTCSQGGITQRAQCRAQEILNERRWSTYGLMIGQVIGQGLSGWFFGQGSGGSGSSGGGQQQCISGYTKTVQNGQVVCSRTQTKPQCVLTANKEDILSGETVVLKWRTTNAQRVNLTEVGNNLSPNGEATVRPTKSTVYTLTAIGSGNDNTETCETTIVVDGAGVTGPTGSAPPQLSCSPNPLQKGRSSTIKWACTSAAVASVGMGIDTDGKISGEVTVSPEFNTGYAVSCLNEDDEEIGRNTCAMTVGESIYDIIVEPETAKRGDRVRVSWSSLFMKSCRVTGPRGFDYTNTQSVVITEPFSATENTVPDQQLRAAIYTLECESQFGGTFTKDVSVQFDRSNN